MQTAISHAQIARASACATMASSFSAIIAYEKIYAYQESKFFGTK